MRDRQKQREYNREYYKSHRDEILLQVSEFYEENRESKLKYAKEYREHNRDSVSSVKKR